MRFAHGRPTTMSARSRAKDLQPVAADEDPSMLLKALSQVIERGSRVQGPAVRAYVDRLRSHDPDATPAEIIKKLERHYLAAVMASGAAVGSAAAFPGIGTLVAMSAVAGETLSSWRPPRSSSSRSPRCTASPPITVSAVARWCWPYSSARTANTRWPT
jgi:hypothetical protein